tara:strand:- start:69 stop:338 length:270 start_codon:yes stop_codon:yes gene_type:complete
MDNNNEKIAEYAQLIVFAIQDMFNEDSDYYIDEKELTENDNLTEFIHALSTVAPCNFLNRITGSNNNHLEFNHTANHLCFQYMKEHDED